MRKFFAVILAILLVVPTYNKVYGTDQLIYKDKISKAYEGKEDATNIINNLKFTDIPENFWAHESIIRTGSLNIVKGYGTTFGINGNVTRQEAIAFAFRAIGYEKEARDLAIEIEKENLGNQNLVDSWALGYLELAKELEMIDENTNPSLNATREEVAFYIVKALEEIDSGIFNNNNETQGLNKFYDYKNINVIYADAVEALAKNNIIKGRDDGNFYPKSSLTRSEMAQIFRNMDRIYYKIMGIESKTGTVAGIKDSQEMEMNGVELERVLYIRVSDGSVNTLKYVKKMESSPQAITKDAVVFKENKVKGLASLEEGDQIEYLVSGNKILYAQVIKSETKEESVEGVLRKIDFENGKITVSSETEKEFTYTMAEGVYKIIDGEKFITIDVVGRNLKTVPIGSKVLLKLLDNIVQEINYIGEKVVIQELRGIVIENNIEFGYISFFDNSGNEIVMYYAEEDVVVEKQMHYDLEDEIGYIDEVFPNFEYDARDTFVSEIEIGDIVFIRPSKENPEMIESISAATNYIVKYGKVIQLLDEDEFYKVLIEYDTKQTNMFSVAKDIFTTKDGKILKTSDIQVGDYLRLLVNQGIITPGYIIESVKEIKIEGNEHYIYTILKGTLSGINSIQKKLQIQNAQALSKTGWANHNQIKEVNLSSNDIEFYHNGKRINLDYALKYLKRSDGVIYVALENNFAGERVKKVTFRDGRDELLGSDTILSTDGNGGFRIGSHGEIITTDLGSIVTREGRLVSGTDIQTSDYGIVSLNDGSVGAIVQIDEMPDTSKIFIVRGRVNSVDDGKSFRVESLSNLSGMEWVYSPVSRDFTIDYDTVYITEEGVVSLDKFLSYTSDSVKDKVFNVLVDGSKATHIIDSPFGKDGVRGTIYEINENEIKIKDASYYNSKTGNWNKVSEKDNSIIVTIPINGFIVQNNKISFVRDLQKGNQIKVMTNTLPEKIASGMNINGYIVLVEK